MYISTVYCVDQCLSATLPTVYNLYLEAALIRESYYTVIYLFFRSLVDSTCISFDNLLLLHTQILLNVVRNFVLFVYPIYHNDEIILIYCKTQTGLLHY